MERSEQINELATALSKAQGMMEGAIKDSRNPHFNSKYADLASCWDAIRGPLSSNGLSVVQFLSSVDGGVSCQTMLMHSSGQWMSSDFFIPVDKTNAHGYGSAATYSRRFSLQAICGIAPVDDDGNAAAAAEPQKRINPLENAMAGEPELAPEVMEVLKELTMDLVEMIEVKGDESGAFKRFTEANLDNEQKMTLWQLLGSKHSKTRTSLNKQISTRQSVRR
jgi:hypothetical protein